MILLLPVCRSSVTSSGLAVPLVMISAGFLTPSVNLSLVFPSSSMSFLAVMTATAIFLDFWAELSLFVWECRDLESVYRSAAMSMLKVSLKKYLKFLSLL